MTGTAEKTTRDRLLLATFAVLSRRGHRSLQLSDVAAEAGVSRPTLYRYFTSKQDLLDAFARYELDHFDSGIIAAMAGLSGPDRLDAALRFVVDYQHRYALRSLVDVEPQHVVEHMKALLPLLQQRLGRLMTGRRADIAAAVVVRVIVSHFILGAGDAQQFLAELRHAAGLAQRRGSAPLGMISAG